MEDELLAAVPARERAALHGALARLAAPARRPAASASARTVTSSSSIVAICAAIASSGAPGGKTMREHERAARAVVEHAHLRAERRVAGADQVDGAEVVVDDDLHQQLARAGVDAPVLAVAARPTARSPAPSPGGASRRRGS